MCKKWIETEVDYAGDIDAELLPITCLCGHNIGYWEFAISIYPDDPYACPMCGRRYYFKNDITVFVEVDTNEILFRRFK